MSCYCYQIATLGSDIETIQQAINHIETSRAKFTAIDAKNQLLAGDFDGISGAVSLEASTGFYNSVNTYVSHIPAQFTNILASLQNALSSAQSLREQRITQDRSYHEEQAAAAAAADNKN